MKHFALATFSLLLSTVALAPAAKAQTIRIYEVQPQAPTYYQSNVMERSRISPFQLSSLAYRGRLSAQGIPGYGNLLVGLNSGSITADDIIEAGVEAGIVSYERMDSSSYETALENQLYTLSGAGD